MSRIIDVFIGDEMVFEEPDYSVLVPESEYLSFREMIRTAKDRNEQEALNLEAAVEAAKES